MTLIKLANHIVNLDNVSQIINQSVDGHPKVILIFNHADLLAKGLFKVTLSGTEAAAFMALFRSSELVRASISPDDIEKAKEEKQEQGKKAAASFGKTSREQSNEKKTQSATKHSSTFGQIGHRKLAL